MKIKQHINERIFHLKLVKMECFNNSKDLIFSSYKREVYKNIANECQIRINECECLLKLLDDIACDDSKVMKS